MRKVFPIAFSSGALLLLGLLLFGSTTGPGAGEDPTGRSSAQDVRPLEVRADSGLTIDVLDDADPTDRRVIYERYRFFNPETGAEIPILQESVNTTFIFADGTERQFSRETAFYPFPIYPPSLVEPEKYEVYIETPEARYAGTITAPDLRIVRMLLPDGSRQIMSVTEAAERGFILEGIDVLPSDYAVLVLPDWTVTGVHPDEDGVLRIDDEYAGSGAPLLLLKTPAEGWVYGTFTPQ